MVKHVVSFKLKGEVSERRRYAEDFKAALLSLPGQIDGLRGMEVGINDNPAEVWDVVLIATLDTMEDVARYAAHPAHVAAAAIIAPVKVDRACVDYTV